MLFSYDDWIDGSDRWSLQGRGDGVFETVGFERCRAEPVIRLGAEMVDSIPFDCQGWASTKAAYRFLPNPEVEMADILSDDFLAAPQRDDICSGPVLLLR